MDSIELQIQIQKKKHQTIKSIYIGFGLQQIIASFPDICKSLLNILSIHVYAYLDTADRFLFIFFLFFYY